MNKMKSNIKEFFKISQKMENDKMKLKMLVTYHIILADRFAGVIMQQLLENWSGFQLKNTELLELLKGYSNIISKIGKNYECYNQCKYQHYYNINDLRDKMAFYYQVINILNFIFNYTKIFDKMLNDHPKFVLLQEAYMLIWNDMIALYLFLENLILQFMDAFKELDINTFESIYAILDDYFNLTNLMKYFDTKQQIEEFRWKKFNKQLLSDIHSHHISILLSQQLNKHSTKSANQSKQVSTRQYFKSQQNSRKVSPMRRNETSISTTKMYGKKISTSINSILWDNNRRFNFD